MSVSHHVYVGIFLEVKTKPMQVYDRTVCTVDSSHKFNVYHNTKFCPICGAPVEELMTEGAMSFRSIDDEDMGFDHNDVDKLNQAFGAVFVSETAEDGVEFLYPTHDKIFTSFIDDDEGVTDVDVAQLVTDTVQAEKLLHDDIQLLLKTIATSVKVRFGVISSWG